MSEANHIGWRVLLNRASALYDEPDSVLARAARKAGNTGFASGAEWMKLAFERIRGRPLHDLHSTKTNFQTLGVLKYAAASGAAAGWILTMWWIQYPILAPLAVPLFYAVEVQGVFLFPLALDGHAFPFLEAPRWTARAGGTIHAMRNVMPIAATMLFGGFFARGFVRSWCLGCLAICIWYEDLRMKTDAANADTRGANAV